MFRSFTEKLPTSSKLSSHSAQSGQPSGRQNGRHNGRQPGQQTGQPSGGQTGRQTGRQNGRASKPAPSARSPQPPQPPQPAADVTRPATVQWAVRFMLAGAAVSALSLIFSVIGAFSLKRDLMSANAENLKLHKVTEAQISSTANGWIIYTIVIGLVSIGLWVWMARTNGAGRSWARITASAFFALWSFYTYGVLGELHGGVTITGTVIVSVALVLVTWLIGLAAVFQLWRPASTAFYKAQSR